MSGPRLQQHRWVRRTLWLVLVVAGALGAVALSLYLTPMQNVTAAGQSVDVGVTAPSWSLRGPGELDLFGQSIPTTVDFAGPVRPRLALSRITFSEQLAQLTNTSPATSAKHLQDALTDGFTRFFGWQIAIVAIIAVVLFGAVAGWLRQGPRRTVGLVASGVVLALALDVGAIMYTVYSAPAKFKTIDSIQALVGDSPVGGTPRQSVPDRDVSNVVVLGDSTAAGLGLPPLADGTAADKACRRSGDAYATALALPAGWHDTNVACSGATIADGILGPQDTGDTTQAPQLDAHAVQQADAIVVSIGANDLHWVDLLKLCAVSRSCSNNAEQAYLQQQLAGFSADLLELVSELQVLPRHPIVVLNQYYDPFAGSIDCLRDVGLTGAKHDALEADLSAMNEILRSGARTAGFLTTAPDFGDHGVCSSAPYVQGIKDAAPFHPTATGELAIALAVSHVLNPGS